MVEIHHYFDRVQLFQILKLNVLNITIDDHNGKKIVPIIFIIHCVWVASNHLNDITLGNYEYLFNCECNNRLILESIYYVEEDAIEVSFNDIEVHIWITQLTHLDKPMKYDVLIKYYLNEARI